MRRAILILGCVAWLSWLGAGRASAQTPRAAAPPGSPSAQGGTQTVDGVAARIEDDIITDSEVRELAAFQQLVDGRSKPRGELIRELADQWIVRGEADTAQYPQPSAEDVERAYAQLEGQFASPEEFKRRCAAAGLSEAAVRRMLAGQLYLSRFLDYRFRPAAQVDQEQLQKYYDGEFAPQLKARGQAVPPLEDVEDTIREVLVQRQINERAQQWLDGTRDRLKIDIMSDGEQP
jgi:hypothetical protein